MPPWRKNNPRAGFFIVLPDGWHAWRETRRAGFFGIYALDTGQLEKHVKLAPRGGQNFRVLALLRGFFCAGYLR